MKKSILKNLVMSVVVLTGLIIPFGLSAQDADKEKDIQHAKDTKASFLKSDPMMKSLFENAAGYAIFPSIGKGAVVIGGATGNGILFEKGKAVGKVNMSQLTVGAQAGGQVYSEVIFFENSEVLNRLKNDKFEFTGQASAVAVKAGITANAKYRDGVMVFSQEKGGLMYEAAVGGQKFTYSKY